MSGSLVARVPSGTDHGLGRIAETPIYGARGADFLLTPTQHVLIAGCGFSAAGAPSRAFKKLGLGPDYSNAINARDSSFDEPPPPSTIPPVQSAWFAEAAGVNR